MSSIDDALTTDGRAAMRRRATLANEGTPDLPAVWVRPIHQAETALAESVRAALRRAIAGDTLTGADRRALATIEALDVHLPLDS